MFYFNIFSVLLCLLSSAFNLYFLAIQAMLNYCGFPPSRSYVLYPNSLLLLPISWKSNISSIPCYPLSPLENTAKVLTVLGIKFLTLQYQQVERGVTILIKYIAPKNGCVTSKFQACSNQKRNVCEMKHREKRNSKKKKKERKNSASLSCENTSDSQMHV